MNSPEACGNMNAFLNDAADALSENELSENIDLFTESLDDFSTDPMAFEELSEMTLRKVDELFRLAASIDRNSKQFIKFSRLIRKGIGNLASACITKVVLMKRDCEFPRLGQLSTDKLCGYASFMMRKCDAALTGQMSKNGDFSGKLMEEFFSYYQVLERLRATDGKIHDINYGLISDDDILKRAWMFTDKAWGKSFKKRQAEPPVYQDARSYPVINPVLRELGGDPNQPENKLNSNPVPALPAAADISSTPDSAPIAETSPEQSVEISEQNIEKSTSSQINIFVTANQYGDKFIILERDGIVDRLTPDQVRQELRNPWLTENYPKVADALREILAKLNSG